MVMIVGGIGGGRVADLDLVVVVTVGMVWWTEVMWNGGVDGGSGLFWVCFLALGFWSWRARKGEVCRHSVLMVVVVLSYLQDVVVRER
jgi:hypothetical protein